MQTPALSTYCSPSAGLLRPAFPSSYDPSTRTPSFVVGVWKSEDDARFGPKTFGRMAGGGLA